MRSVSSSSQMLPPQIALVDRFTRTLPVDILGLADALAIEVTPTDAVEVGSERLERREDAWRLTVATTLTGPRLRFAVALAVARTILEDHRDDAGLADDGRIRDYAAGLLMPWQVFKAACDTGGPTAAAARFGVDPDVARQHFARVAMAATRARTAVLFPGAPESEAERLLAQSIAVLATTRQALVARLNDGPDALDTTAIRAIDALFRDFGPWATHRLKRGPVSR